jgi:alkanesulfonate monooxygenase SsuD/methylene tetrahydromethanopterin reductase-like flavin-dependent oxidoreductase (luciferase family)
VERLGRRSLQLSVSSEVAMTRGMNFGFLYDFRNPAQWRKSWPDMYAETLEFIAWTETLGVDAAWVAEHHVAEDGYLPSPLIALSAIAARTKRLRIGSAVALAPFYHPVRFAEDAAIVDIIANGRLEVGVALGYRRRETDAYGLDFAARAGRMEEFIQIVRRLWTGETFDFEGRHFRLKNASIMPRPPRGHIPLLIGGFSPKAMQRVARYGDAYLGRIELAETYRDLLAACGRDPSQAKIYIPSLTLVAADDPERALQELAPYYYYLNNSYGDWLSEDQYESRIALENIPKRMSLEEFKASGLLQVLTPDEAVAMLQGLRAQGPVEHVTVSVPPGIPLSKFAPYVETFANKVLPAFR